MARRLDLGLSRAADDAFPAEARTVEPVGQLDPAQAAAPVLDLGEGGDAAAGCCEVRAGGDGAALAPAAAEIDRDQRQAVGSWQGCRGRRQGAGETGQRPAVGGHQRMVVAGVWEPGSAGDPPCDRSAEGVAGVDLAARGESGDRRQQEQRDQRRQAGLLDTRGSPLALACGATLGLRARAWCAKSQGLCARLSQSAYIPRVERASTSLATPTSSAPAWRSSASRCSPRSASPGPTTRSASRPT